MSGRLGSINAHCDLDAAVAAAYGWPADISQDEALSRLLVLNLKRAGPVAGCGVPSRPLRGG